MSESHGEAQRRAREWHGRRVVTGMCVDEDASLSGHVGVPERRAESGGRCCWRGRVRGCGARTPEAEAERAHWVAVQQREAREAGHKPVSYTHLTLPTKA